MALANSTSQKACHGLDVAAMAVKIGTVHTVPSAPNDSSIGRRPIRSDSPPITGCRTMKQTSAPLAISPAVRASNPDVLTRNFCMYVVYV